MEGLQAAVGAWNRLWEKGKEKTQNKKTKKQKNKKTKAHEEERKKQYNIITNEQ